MLHALERCLAVAKGRLLDVLAQAVAAKEVALEALHHVLKGDIAEAAATRHQLPCILILLLIQPLCQEPIGLLLLLQVMAADKGEKVSKVDIVLLSLPADTADGQLPWQQVIFLEGRVLRFARFSFFFFLFFLSLSLPRRSKNGRKWRESNLALVLADKSQLLLQQRVHGRGQRLGRAAPFVWLDFVLPCF